MNTKKTIEVMVGLIIVGLLATSYFYFSQSEKVEKESAVDTAKTVSESVPKIITNPAEEVPEVNPFDRANPFKYTNPLR